MTFKAILYSIPIPKDVIWVSDEEFATVEEAIHFAQTHAVETGQNDVTPSALDTDTQVG